MYIEVSLTEGDEARDVSYAVRSQMVKLNLVQVKNEAKEGMNRGQSPLSRWYAKKMHSSWLGSGDTSAIGTCQG